MAEDRADVPDKPPSAPRRRWWIWLPAGCFGFMLVIFLLGMAVVSGRARSRWKEFGPRHAQLKARVLDRPAEREPLEGVAVEGNAFEPYVALSTALWKMSSDDKSAIDNALAGKGGPDAEAKAFAVLDAHAAELEGFRKAARLSAYKDSLDYEAGWAASLDWIGPFRFTARLFELSAIRRREAGDLDGAIDDVVALAQLGLDVGSSGPAICHLVGISILRFATNQGGAIVCGLALTPVQAARLVRLFERAEAALRSLHDVLESEHLLINETLAAFAEGRGSMEELGFPSSTRFLAWRQGFSWRVVAADVDEACSRVSEQGREMSERDWPQARAAYEKTELEWQSDTLLSMLHCATSSIDRSSRSIRARFRMIRAVAHERATGAPLALDDPFTLKPLHRRDAAGSSLWWSEWTDGDNGGAGKFEDDPQSGGDIPLEWKRSE